MKAQLIAAVAATLCGAARAGLSPDLPAANPWPIRETRWGRARPRTLSFYDDGTCEFDCGERGTWDCTAEVVSIETTAPRRDGGDETLRYHCFLHRNVFGSQPRLLKGVKSRDRRPPFPPSLLRPVLASFSTTAPDRRGDASPGDQS